MSAAGKATAGPLTTRRAPKPDNVGGYDYAIVDSEGRIVAETFEVVDDGDKRDAKALADLFAAAPQLADALRMIADSTCDHGAGPDCPREIASAALRRIR